MSVIVEWPMTGLRGKVKGNKTFTVLVDQLAASGQTAGLQTLAGASKAQLAQISKAYSGMNAQSMLGGNAATAIKFGGRIRRAAERRHRRHP